MISTNSSSATVRIAAAKLFNHLSSHPVRYRKGRDNEFESAASLTAPTIFSVATTLAKIPVIITGVLV